MINNNDYNDIEKAVESVEDTIKKVAQQVWQLAELSLFENKSSSLIIRTLEDNGFDITSRETANVPTAFIAEYTYNDGKDNASEKTRPIIGILAEYDALPGLANEAVASLKPIKEDDNITIKNGHGCGHNLIGAGALGAAISLKKLMSERKIKGTLRVYGCAAEETQGAKVYMARAKLFNDLDAALHWHPVDQSFVGNVRTAATNSMYVEFTGTSAHAGLNPWLGRSSVHAAELFAHGVNLMREHVEPTARIHYIYENGGVAPNVVPDYAKVWLTCRDVDRDRVNKMTDWLKKIADGAALATETKAKLSVFIGLYDILPNQPLAERMQGHLMHFGMPAYDENEQKFAIDIQKAFLGEQTIAENQKGMVKKPLDLLALSPEPPKLGGSSDVGDVSYNTPTMGIAFATVPIGISMHSWAATACHGMSIGFKGAIAAAKVLAATGLDLLTDSELRDTARSDFEKRTEGIVYEAAIDKDQDRPIGLPPRMIEPHQREMFSQVVSST